MLFQLGVHLGVHRSRAGVVAEVLVLLFYKFVDQLVKCFRLRETLLLVKEQLPGHYSLQVLHVASLLVD